jgi:hypothetical protein
MSHPLISYRDATPADGAVLGGIARATFIDTFGTLYRLEDMATFLKQGSDEAYAAELADADISVRFALTGGTPIGFCKVSSLKLPAPDPAPGAMELRQLYIYTPWQGLGIAVLLSERRCVARHPLCWSQFSGGLARRESVAPSSAGL